MYEINERIKELRKHLDLSQTEFGKRFGVGLGVIRNFEYGITAPNDIQIDLICVTFHVNREWLTTGEGEMFRERTRSEKVAAFVGEALADKPESFRRAFIEVVADFGPEEWTALERIAKMFVDRANSNKKEQA